MSRLHHEQRQHTNPEEIFTAYSGGQDVTPWRTEDALERNSYLRNMFTGEQWELANIISGNADVKFPQLRQDGKRWQPIPVDRRESRWTNRSGVALRRPRQDQWQYRQTKFAAWSSRHVGTQYADLAVERPLYTPHQTTRPL